MPNQTDGELIKCPVCNKVIRPWKVGRRPICRHVSHNCLEIWLPAPCPICLVVRKSVPLACFTCMCVNPCCPVPCLLGTQVIDDVLTRKLYSQDVVPPPNIALPCGHVVCPEDFKLMGGKVQERMEDYGDESEEEEEVHPEGFEEMVRRSRLESDFRATRAGGNAAIGMDASDDDDDHDDDSHASMPRMVLDPSVDSTFFRNEGAFNTDASDDSEPSPPTAHTERSNEAEGIVGEYAPDSLPGPIQQRVIESAPPADRNAAVQSVPAATDGSQLASHILRQSVPQIVYEPQSQANTISDVVYCMRRDNHSQVWKLTESGMDLLVGLLHDRGQNDMYLVKSATAFAVATRGPPARAAHHSVDGGQLNDGYSIDSNVQVVADESGFWTLGPIAGARDTSMLKYYGNQFPNGKSIRRVSSQSTLYRGSNSCWVHVQRRSTDIDSGLWFFKTNGQKHTLRASDISPHALIAPNVDKSVWVMQREQSRTTLRRVGMNGRSSSDATLECECTRQSSLITTGRNNGGVYIHTRQQQARQQYRWSLFVYENNVLRRLAEGHRDAQLAVDRNGNAWILKRSMHTSASHNLRLFKVDARNDAVIEIHGRFEDVVSLTGAFYRISRYSVPPKCSSIFGRVGKNHFLLFAESGFLKNHPITTQKPLKPLEKPPRLNTTSKDLSRRNRTKFIVAVTTNNPVLITLAKTCHVRKVPSSSRTILWHYSTGSLQVVEL